MNFSNSTFLLRFAVATILLVHGAAGMFDNGVNNFGNLYLNPIGFAPFGLYLAWAIKLSHVATAVCLLLEKYVKPAAIVTIFILIMGIVMIHFKEGWFVVGGGRNGYEYNFLLIFVLLTIMLPNGFAGLNRSPIPGQNSQKGDLY
jgi:putative oxidoreductase